MKTEAAVLRKVGGPLEIEELDIPRLGRGQVLVKILASGLCRSQLNEIDGRKGAEFIPHLLGHEASGVVLEVGEGVKKVKAGDYVVCSWIKGDGLDAPMVQYRDGNGGVVNAGAVATFCTYAVISENRLIKISALISSEVAALLGCAVPTGAGIVDSLDIKPGQKIAVFGVGGIGASVLLRAGSLWGVKSYAFDVIQWKLDWARQRLNVDSELFVNAPAHFGEFDFAVECSGSKEAMETAFQCINNSGTAIIAGNLKAGETISIDPFGLIKGKKLQGTWGGGCHLESHIPKYAEAFMNGDFPIDCLITENYCLGQINTGLNDLKDGKIVRGVINF